MPQGLEIEPLILDLLTSEQPDLTILTKSCLPCPKEDVEQVLDDGRSLINAYSGPPQRLSVAGAPKNETFHEMFERALNGARTLPVRAVNFPYEGRIISLMYAEKDSNIIRLLENGSILEEAVPHSASNGLPGTLMLRTDAWKRNGGNVWLTLSENAHANRALLACAEVMLSLGQEHFSQPPANPT